MKEFAKIVGLPQILKLPLFAGHPSMWQMFVYSIFSDKNKLRDVCRLPIIDLKCIQLDAMLWEKVGGQFCNSCDLPQKNHRFLRQLLEVVAVIVCKNSEQCDRIC